VVVQLWHVRQVRLHVPVIHLCMLSELRLRKHVRANIRTVDVPGSHCDLDIHPRSCILYSLSPAESPFLLTKEPLSLPQRHQQINLRLHGVLQTTDGLVVYGWAARAFPVNDNRLYGEHEEVDPLDFWNGVDSGPRDMPGCLSCCSPDQTITETGNLHTF